MKHLLLLLLPLAERAHTAQRFSREPQDVRLTAGEEAVLPCRVEDIQGDCQWTKDGFGLGTSRRVPGFPRYTMREGGGGHCDLTISPVLPSDEASYQCQVGAGTGFSAISSRTAAVRVSSVPGTPYIRQAEDRDVLEVVERQTLVLDCFSQGARPPAEIHWHRDGQRMAGNIKETVSREQGGDTFRTHSSLTFRPTSNVKIKCSSYSDQFPETRYSRELSIRLRYPPKLDIKTPETVKEGDKFSVTCDSKAYPENVAYKWYFDGVELAGETEKTLMIEDISRENHQSDIKCSVENEVGVTEVATSLNVQFPPRLVTSPRSVLAHRGENVTFHCQADSNPRPLYVWTRHRVNTLEAVTQNLTLVASDKTEMTYVCKVFSDGHEKISSLPARLVLIRRPFVYTEMLKEAKIGEDIVLTCLVDSLSNMTTIHWTRDDAPIRVDNHKYKVLETNKGREYQTDLVIRNLQSEDLGSYGCFAANEVGKGFAPISIVCLNELSITTVATGIAIPVLLILILAVVVRKYWCSPPHPDYQPAATKG